ncbi:hypothetical protein T459_19200 [Capsicum annuum]|uniref:Small ribosomal subunit protein mS23 n=1 Tax=Capsicum annuum TaxID=4072 RepID=A0A2G2Z112_CAPAN|nr:hypothetical protein T459_19200 [Capsicum annuum]
MSFMKGDLLNRTRRLVKGLAKAEPMWLKAMEQSVPSFRFFILYFTPIFFNSGCVRYEENVLSLLILSKQKILVAGVGLGTTCNISLRENKLQPISLPENVYIKKFFQKHPESKHEDAIKIFGFNPPPARDFGWRVLELKTGVSEEEVMAVADMEYQAEKKGKNKAYSRLKKIARLQGRKPPTNPYPSAIMEIQAEERPFGCDRFYN